MKVISPYLRSQNKANPKHEMGVREKCFFTVCVYLGNTDQGRMTLVCVLPEAEGSGCHRGPCCGCSHLSHPQRCQGSRAIIHLGWMCWAFEGEIWRRGNALCTSNWSIKHLCGAGGDEALWDGLWLSGFGPSSANYEGRREPEVWPPFSQLVEHMSHPNKDQLVFLCWGMAQEKAEGSLLELSTLSRACSCARHGPAHLIPAVHAHPSFYLSTTRSFSWAALPHLRVICYIF